MSPVPYAGYPKTALLKGTKGTFVLSNILYEKLRNRDYSPNGVTAECAKEIKRLQDLGFWYKSSRPFEISDRFIALSLHLIHGCNLACIYCNVQEGTYGDDLTFMDESTAYAAIEYLAKIRKGRFPRLIFYGGEPLLNWEVLTQSAERMASVFSQREMQVVTNGTVIDEERAEFLAKYDIFTILSMDGPKWIHDRNRPMKDGGSSYEKARKGLECLKKAGVRFHIRATWIPGFAGYNEIFQHLTGIAEDSRKVSVGIEFGYADDNGVEEYNRALAGRYRQAEQKRLDLPNSVYVYLDMISKADLAPVARCEAGHAGLSVTPSGELYPCQVSVSKGKYHLGNIWQGIDEQGKKNLEIFLNRFSPACKTCWVRPYCPGPCSYAGPISEELPYCKTIKLEVIEALKWMAKASDQELSHIYYAREEPSRIPGVFKYGLALRKLLWKHNRHIKPLAIYSQKAVAL